MILRHEVLSDGAQLSMTCFAYRVGARRLISASLRQTAGDPTRV